MIHAKRVPPDTIIRGKHNAGAGRGLAIESKPRSMSVAPIDGSKELLIKYQPDWSNCIAYL